VTQEAMADACRKRDLVAPLTMFKALRMQMDELGTAPDLRSMASRRFLISCPQAGNSSFSNPTAVDPRIGKRHSRSNDQ
jgi:succinate dehydrogenase/fumarate reductase-like Fe-S protein